MTNSRLDNFMDFAEREMAFREERKSLRQKGDELHKDVTQIMSSNDFWGLLNAIRNKCQAESKNIESDMVSLLDTGISQHRMNGIPDDCKDVVKWVHDLDEAIMQEIADTTGYVMR